jgi:REP element-mobilizing transposase RayT
MTMAVRQRGWLTPAFHQNFRAVLVRAIAKYHVVVPAYCLMPDHLHLIAAGMTSDADQQLWARAIRRALNRLLLPRKLQKQAYDHVLRTTETNGDAFAAVIYYVCENPVRARLAGTALEWPYSGACVPDVPTLDPRQADFRELWWTYWNSRQK